MRERSRNRTVWTRGLARLRREIATLRHGRGDDRMLKEAAALLDLRGGAIETVANRLSAASSSGLILREPPHVRVDALRAADPSWADRAETGAEEALRGVVRFFGTDHDLARPAGWHEDPLRERAWPSAPHARIRLDNPRQGGDVRMVWERGRFHHGILLGRAWAATNEPAYVEAFLRQIESFERACPPYRSVHWAVGMEIAIRATAWIFTLEFMRGAPPLNDAWQRRLAHLLAIHGLFLESHLERHPSGVTTNHTFAGAAGLAVLGRLFDETDHGRRWSDLASRELDRCLEEQITPDGAHREASLPYERFVLETVLIALLALRAGPDSMPTERARAIARHLSDATLGQRLPHVGDSDDSFFPPFLLRRHAERNPLDPKPVLDASSSLLALPDLRRDGPTDESAYWLGAGLAAARSNDRQVPPVLVHSGYTRFEKGAFRGLLISRDRGQAWLPTHGHNDLLSLLLDVDGWSVLIDPGTGGYGCDRTLRHLLRSTGAHSTLQVDAVEQSPIHERRTFEGPAAVEGTLDVREVRCGVEIEASHRGLGGGMVHTRRIRPTADRLWIVDRLDGPPGGVVESVLRWRLAPGLDPRPVKARGRPALSVRLPVSEVRFLLLRPSGAGWHTVTVPSSGRYGDRTDAPALEGRHRAPLPHRWVTAVERIVPREP